MAPVDVVLFTPFPPDIGGGAVHLRSALHFLDGLNVLWAYTGVPGTMQPNSVCLGPGYSSLPSIKRLAYLPMLYLAGKSKILRDLHQVIIHSKAKVLWTVAMDEGIPAARSAASTWKIPVHISVHDDPSRALARRSRTLWVGEPIIESAFRHAVQSANSVDVICAEMAESVTKRTKTDPFIFYRCLPTLPPVKSSSPEIHNTSLSLGHIGNPYDVVLLKQVIREFSNIGTARSLPTEIILIGCDSKTIGELQLNCPSNCTLTNLGNLPETKAIEALAGCHMTCAIYPFDLRSQAFRETSMQTKLSTYLLVQRPLLAVTPRGSTLANFVQNHDIGTLASGTDSTSLTQAIQQTLEKRVRPCDWADSIAKLCDPQMGQQFRNAVEKLLSSSGILR